MKKVLLFFTILIVGGLLNYLFFSFAVFLFNGEEPFNIFSWIFEVKLFFLIFMFLIIVGGLLTVSSSKAKTKIKCPNCEEEFDLEQNINYSSSSGMGLGSFMALGIAMNGSNF